MSQRNPRLKTLRHRYWFTEKVRADEAPDEEAFADATGYRKASTRIKPTQGDDLSVIISVPVLLIDGHNHFLQAV